jgi:cytidylate kinase
MSDSLVKYFQDRLKIVEEPNTKPGPVLTISREYGCQAKLISQELADRLNEYHLPIGAKNTWHILSKEIMDKVAHELDIDSTKIDYVFNFEKKSSVDDFIMSLSSRQYHSDWKVRNTIRKVVRSFAVTGHIIILGRAGAQITRDIEASLHIRLNAPFQWRVNHVMEKYQLTNKLAVRKVKEMDVNREKLIRNFASKGHCHECYDVSFNMKYLNTKEAVSDIIHLMQLKKLI